MTATMHEQSSVRSPDEGRASRVLVPEMWATIDTVAHISGTRTREARPSSGDRTDDCSCMVAVMTPPRELPTL